MWRRWLVAAAAAERVAPGCGQWRTRLSPCARCLSPCTRCLPPGAAANAGCGRCCLLVLCCRHRDHPRVESATIAPGCHRQSLADRRFSAGQQFPAARRSPPGRQFRLVGSPRLVGGPWLVSSLRLVARPWLMGNLAVVVNQVVFHHLHCTRKNRSFGPFKVEVA